MRQAKRTGTGWTGSGLGRGVAVCLALAFLAGALTMGGCGGAGVDPAASAEQDARTREAAQRRAAIVETLDLLESVGMKLWGDYGRYLMSKDRLKFVDFSAPEKNEFGVTGLDGAADIEGQMVYIDQTVALKMPPRHLTIVMLDEMAHLYYRTPSHDPFDKLHAEFIERWQITYGRPFNELGPEDADYQEWWDAFLGANPRRVDDALLPGAPQS